MPRIITILTFLSLLPYVTAMALTLPTDSVDGDQTQLQEVVVSGGRSRMSRVSNTELIGRTQLVRAACCNLGESFTTNPSVDVSYSDASTGAKQIKLLGLDPLEASPANVSLTYGPYC